MQDGRAAYIALLGQHLGKSAWRKMVHDANEYFAKATWSGTSTNNPFANFANKHRAHYNNIVNASKHVQATIPDEHTRVSNLLAGIQTTDTEFCTKKSAIQDTEDDVDGPFYNFEAAVQRLAPACPVARLRGKRKLANISETVALGTTVDEANISDLSAGDVLLKSGIGKTGVRLGWHKRADHMKLSKEQKDELREWLKQNPDQRQTVDRRPKTEKQREKRKEKRKGRAVKQAKTIVAAVLGELAKEANVSSADGSVTPQASNTTTSVSLTSLLSRIQQS